MRCNAIIHRCDDVPRERSEVKIDSHHQDDETQRARVGRGAIAHGLLEGRARLGQVVDDSVEVLGCSRAKLDVALWRASPAIRAVEEVAKSPQPARERLRRIQVVQDLPVVREDIAHRPFGLEIDSQQALIAAAIRPHHVMTLIQPAFLGEPARELRVRQGV